MEIILIKIIKIYQKNFTWVGSLWGILFPADCRFWPSCSEYTKEALTSHGWRKGLWLGVKRIWRCHPFGKGGIDLVPS